MNKKKILILKNDRVGDLFHSIKGINSILSTHKDYKIEIILSNFSKDISFLFNLKNLKAVFLILLIIILNCYPSLNMKTIIITMEYLMCGDIQMNMAMNMPSLDINL